MKKKFAAVLAALCLIAAIAPQLKALAAADVCFVSVNDRLLDLSSKAESVGGGWYVPCSVFSEFGISYNFFSSNSTVMLFNADKQFFFDLANGVTSDASDNYYSASGVLSNGVAYVPVSFVCAQFGLNWTYIPGSGCGNICRIKNAGAILSDTQFLAAASSQMTAKYAAYMNAVNPVTPATGTPSRQPTGTKTVYLSFQGLPSDGILKALSGSGIDASFFLTGDEIRGSPALVRRIVGEGNSVGILCETYAEFKAGASLLYEAAHVMTLLAAAPGGSEKACKAMAAENGLVYCGYAIDGIRDGRGLEYSGSVTSHLAAGDNYVRLLCCSATTRNIGTLTNWFTDNKCSVFPESEIHNG